MRDMFYNYDNDINLAASDLKCSQELSCEKQDENIIITVDGRVLGVKINHLQTNMLYLNLTEESNKDIRSFVQESNIIIDFLNMTGKIVYSKNIPGYKIFNISTNDLELVLTPEDLSNLKLEPHNLQIFCQNAETKLLIFNNKDFYISIR